MAAAFATESVSKPGIHRRIDQLAAKLRRRQLVGSRVVALEVIRLLREVVSGARYYGFAQLIDHLLEIGKRLQDAGPKELVITNVILRVRLLLTEEYTTALTQHLSKFPNSPGTGSIPPTPALGGPSAIDGATSSPSGGITSFFPERDIAGTPRGTAPNGAGMGTLFDLLGHKSAKVIGETSVLSPGLATPGLYSAGLSTPGLTRGFSAAFIGQQSPPTSPGGSDVGSVGSSQILQKGSLAAGLAHVGSGGLVSTTSSTADLVAEEEFSRESYKLKPHFMDAIKELYEEVETTHTNVAEQSLDHIHSGEFILTLGHSLTVESFLRAAHRKRTFTVIVAETAPSFSGRALAASLSASGIPTILIPDSNVFSLLPRCSKVLLGPHLVSADGALLSIAGSLPMCLAARRLGVPVAVVSGMYKFGREYLAGEEWGMRDLGSPEEVLKPGEVEEGEETEVLNPYYDVVPAELVSLYITNLGGHPSSLLSRLLTEQYGAA